MTNQEFIIWMRGFADGAHEYNITPKQWELLKEKLAEVEDEPIRTSGYITPFAFTTGSSSTFSIGGFPNTTLTYTTSNDKTLLND